MMFMRKLLLVMFTILLLVGCGQNNDENTLETKNAENPYVQVKNSDPNNQQKKLF